MSVGSEPDPKPILETDSAKLQSLSIGEVKQMLKKLNTTRATSKEDFPTWIYPKRLQKTSAYQFVTL